ncbi:hypothetical protein [Nocardia sp. NPDC019395]|uniref:hypothetical protein n=1 Tax=Nocardia sp. NPDC019395 TaxID=3154686 RepID=UPI0033D5C0D3
MTDLVEHPTAGPPPGVARRFPRGLWRTVATWPIALVLTPVAVGIAANGAVLAGRWWDPVDRWLAPAQSVLGALLLLLVASLAVSVPTAPMIAGAVWGIAPGMLQIVVPEDTYRLISALPGLPTDLDRALHNWLSGGVVLLLGALLFGAGLTAALLRRRLTPT